MAENQGPSFIPKHAPGMLPSNVRKRKRFHVLGFVGNALLIASIVLAVGAYFYEGFAESRLENEKLALEEERGRFDESDLIDIKNFARRLDAATFLLDNHITPTTIFDMLELNTKENIQFTSLQMSQSPSQNMQLSIKGGTEEFNTIALQALQFADTTFFKDAVVTNLSTRGVNVSELAEGASVTSSRNQHDLTFDIVATIPAGLLQYEGLDAFKNQAAPEVEVETTAPATDGEMILPEGKSSSEFPVEGADATEDGATNDIEDNGQVAGSADEVTTN
ncbi:hypothetical protein KC727_00390 [Candidatus Kaiserbacteria bacterium]|nr:hypothetical protein [Candidatus Kaiserbacteria bacterium]